MNIINAQMNLYEPEYEMEWDFVEMLLMQKFLAYFSERWYDENKA